MAGLLLFVDPHRRWRWPVFVEIKTQELNITMAFARKALCAALFSGTAAIFAAAPVHAAVVTVTLATPISITNSIDGIYLNIVTGVSGASGAAVAGWDINPYNNNAGLTFYGAASPSGILVGSIANPATTSVALSLAPGATVGPAGIYNQFQNVGTQFQGTTGIQYLGFRFQNEATAAQNYGYLVLNTTTGTGFPAQVLGWAYENTGAGLTVAVPEPATYAMFGAGLLGMLALRRRRSA
jgi:hypothetical protein